MDCRRGEIAVGVEGVVVRTQHGVVPDAFAGLRWSAFVRHSPDSHDIEAVLHRLERLVREQRIGSTLTVAVELIHLVCRIAFGHDGEVDTLADVATTDDVTVGDAVLADGTNQYVRWINEMCHHRRHLVVIVGECHADVDGSFGERDVVAGLERTTHLGSFLFVEPLLEEGGEGVDIDESARSVVEHVDLGVAQKVSLGQTGPATSPSRLLVELAELDVL